MSAATASHVAGTVLGQATSSAEPAARTPETAASKRTREMWSRGTVLAAPWIAAALLALMTSLRAPVPAVEPATPDAAHAGSGLVMKHSDGAASSALEIETTPRRSKARSASPSSG